MSSNVVVFGTENTLVRTTRALGCVQLSPGCYINLALARLVRALPAQVYWLPTDTDFDPPPHVFGPTNILDPATDRTGAVAMLKEPAGGHIIWCDSLLPKQSELQDLSKNAHMFGARFTALAPRPGGFTVADLYAVLHILNLGHAPGAQCGGQCITAAEIGEGMATEIAVEDRNCPRHGHRAHPYVYCASGFCQMCSEPESEHDQAWFTRQGEQTLRTHP